MIMTTCHPHHKSFITKISPGNTMVIHRNQPLPSDLMAEHQPSNQPQPQTQALPAHLTARFIKAMEGMGDAVIVLSFPADYVPKPEWIKMPPRGSVCSYCSLPDSTLRDMIERSKRTAWPIKKRHARQPGASKGITLIHYKSLMTFIENLPESAPKADARIGAGAGETVNA